MITKMETFTSLLPHQEQAVEKLKSILNSSREVIEDLKDD